MRSKTVFLLFFIGFVAPLSFPQSPPSAVPALDFRDGEGRAWLKDIVFSVTRQGHEPIHCTPPRYAVSSKENAGRTTCLFQDKKGILDVAVEILRLGSRSARVSMKVSNRSNSGVFLDRLTVLSGRVPGSGRFGFAMPNGMTSWAGPELILLEPGMKEHQSDWTLAVQEPSLATGFLTGRRNINRFTFSTDDRDLLITAFGLCDGCLLPAKATRESDPLFISAEPNPLSEMERFADLAAEANGAPLRHENFATWCSWYSGWIRQGMYGYKNGLEAGIEDNIPRVARHFSGRRANWMRIAGDGDTVN